MTISEKLKQFVAYKKKAEGRFTEAMFQEMAGLTGGFVSQERKSIGSEKLLKIHRAFPELNILWLIGADDEMVIQADASGRKKSVEFTEGGLPKMLSIAAEDRSMVKGMKVDQSRNAMLKEYQDLTARAEKLLITLLEDKESNQ